jgi:predicted exporter
VTSFHAADTPDGGRGLTKRRRLILLSPIIVVILGHATARVAGQLWDVWSWIPVMLVYGIGTF